MNLRTKIFLDFLLLFSVVLVGTLGYIIIEHWEPFDALYMTVITLTTIGFGEIHPLTDIGRVFTIFLILTGIGTITYTIGSISAYFFGQKMYEILHNKTMRDKIEKLKDHFIVCGASEVGLAVINEIMLAKIPVLLIDQDEMKLIKANKELKCLTILGDATDDVILKKSRIKNARGLIASFGNDHENVYLIMSARELNHSLQIYAKVKDEKNTKKLLLAGANQVINPYTIGGMRMASAILRPNVVKLMDELAKDPKKLRVEELVFDAQNPMLKTPMSISTIEKKLKVRIIAYKKEKKPFYQYLFDSTPINFSIGDSLFYLEAKEKFF